MLEIDASTGEGGGQVLRTCLSLSILTRRPIRLTRIRANRAKPGLQAQHLASVRAAAAVSQARVEGDAPGSSELAFTPGEARPGRYRFEIGTAGSTSLVLQTIALPLAFAPGSSTTAIQGGTHVPWSPPFHYLDRHWLAVLRPLGLRLRLSLGAAGFYPQGGGAVTAAWRPSRQILPLQRLERGPLRRIRGLAAVANLDRDIARRLKLQALRRLEPVCQDSKIETIELPSPVKGAFLLLIAEFEHSQACASALGAPGKRAERVADEAADDLLACLDSGAAFDAHLADQLLLPLAFAAGPSAFSASRASLHLLTNADILRRFLPVEVDIQGGLDQPAVVRITPP